MQVLLLMIAFAGLFLNDIADAFFVIGLGVTTFLSVWKCKWFLIPILFLAWYTSSLDILLIAVCPEKDIILNFFHRLIKKSARSAYSPAGATRTCSSGGTLVAALKWRRKYQRSVDIVSHETIPLAGSDASKKERSVFYRGVERTEHSEALAKISQRLV